MKKIINILILSTIGFNISTSYATEENIKSPEKHTYNQKNNNLKKNLKEIIKLVKESNEALENQYQSIRHNKNINYTKEAAKNFVPDGDIADIFENRLEETSNAAENIKILEGKIKESSSNLPKESEQLSEQLIELMQTVERTLKEQQFLSHSYSNLTNIRKYDMRNRFDIYNNFLVDLHRVYKKSFYASLDAPNPATGRDTPRYDINGVLFYKINEIDYENYKIRTFDDGTTFKYYTLKKDNFYKHYTSWKKHIDFIENQRESELSILQNSTKIVNIIAEVINENKSIFIQDENESLVLENLTNLNQYLMANMIKIDKKYIDDLNNVGSLMYKSDLMHTNAYKNELESIFNNRSIYLIQTQAYAIGKEFVTNLHGIPDIYYLIDPYTIIKYQLANRFIPKEKDRYLSYYKHVLTKSRFLYNQERLEENMKREHTVRNQQVGWAPPGRRKEAYLTLKKNGLNFYIASVAFKSFFAHQLYYELVNGHKYRMESIKNIKKTNEILQNITKDSLYFNLDIPAYNDISDTIKEKYKIRKPIDDDFFDSQHKELQDYNLIPEIMFSKEIDLFFEDNDLQSNYDMWAKNVVIFNKLQVNATVRLIKSSLDNIEKFLKVKDKNLAPKCKEIDNFLQKHPEKTQKNAEMHFDSFVCKLRAKYDATIEVKNENFWKRLFGITKKVIGEQRSLYNKKIASVKKTIGNLKDDYKYNNMVSYDEKFSTDNTKIDSSFLDDFGFKQQRKDYGYDKPSTPKNK